MPIQRFKKALTVTAGAYSTNDVVGGRIEFTGLRRGTLQAITITDNSAQETDYLLVFFESQPTDIADNATFDITDADLVKIIYQATLYAFPHLQSQVPNRQAFTDNAYHFLYDLDEPLWASGGSVWAFLIAIAGAPTYAATSDVTVTLQVDMEGNRVGLSTENRVSA